jgi:hypothetical protein
MRHQEDQIYALEDYLSEYQQLLCDARSQNADLKRQLAKGQFREGSSNHVPDEADTRPSRQRPTPSTRSPDEPKTDDSSLEVPPLDLDAPTVPPLDTSSNNEPHILAAQEVVPASAEVEVVAAPPSAVVLRGEVQVGSRDSDPEAVGPRVLLNIEPVDDQGAPLEFHGRMSLLVLDPAAADKQRQLARWDFSNQQLAELATPADQGYELPLQLPIESPTNRPLELWVRLLPEDGEKVLGRTTLDVGRPGKFASAEVATEKKHAPPPRHQVEPAAAEMPIVVKSSPSKHLFDTNVEQSGWHIAKPGEVAPSQTGSRQDSSEWKMATRPIPEVESTPFAESKPVNATPASQGNDRYHVAEAPSWAPNRPGGESSSDDETDQSQPTWTPTR